jgi:multidrug efflux pump subunit AcrB
LGMIPMALGVGEGGEQNAPLARAVIGGLLFATAATMIFVPVVYRMLRPAVLSGAVLPAPVVSPS